MKNPLACRVTRLDRLAAVVESGLAYVEIEVPSQEDMQTVQSLLERHGLRVSTVAVRMDVQSDEGIAHVAGGFERAAALGASIVFTSVKAGEANLADVYARLRQVGDWAAAHNLTVAIETHPDLASNGDLAYQTMQAVNHPNIRINFDPANIYYYNEQANGLQELRKILPYVAAVHLKDTMGEYRSNDFPPVGQGVVDFPGIFALLNESSYSGPFTFEIEGSRLRGDQDGTKFSAFLKESVAYLDTLPIGPKRPPRGA